MKPAISVLMVVVLCALYFVGLGEVTGILARTQFPWQPFLGKPAWEVDVLLFIEDFTGVLIVASIVAIAIALRFTDHVFRFSLVVAAPGALYLAWSFSQTLTVISPSVVHIAMTAMKIIYLLFTPALLASAFKRFKPTLHKQSWPAA